jgi:hypothetical protein
VQHTSAAHLGLIGKNLRSSLDAVAKEPLPERWVDLIHHLNEQERVQADRHRQLHAARRACRRLKRSSAG